MEIVTLDKCKDIEVSGTRYSENDDQESSSYGEISDLDENVDYTQLVLEKETVKVTERPIESNDNDEIYPNHQTEYHRRNVRFINISTVLDDIGDEEYIYIESKTPTVIELPSHELKYKIHIKNGSPGIVNHRIKSDRFIGDLNEFILQAKASIVLIGTEKGWVNF